MTEADTDRSLQFVLDQGLLSGEQQGSMRAKEYMYSSLGLLIPFTDHVLSDVQERFADHNRAVYCLSTTIPAFVNQYAFDALLPAVEMHQAFIDDSHDKLRAEFELWKQRWHAAAEPPKTALEANTACSASLYDIQTYPSCCRCSSLYPSPLHTRQSVPFPLSNG